jgi:cAMP-binding proteins - catabolite gene activator and regulatory subunit of cAMP-dependent protein kinases
METDAYYKSPWLTEPDVTGDGEILTKYGEKHAINKGGVVYSQGDVVNEYIFFLLSGRIRIVSVSPKGEERTLSILEPGVFFGEAAFFDRNVRFASAEAIAPSEVLRFDRDSAMALLEEKPSYYHLIFKSMSQKIRILSMQVEDLTFWPIEKRLCRLLLRLISDFGVKTESGIALSVMVTDEQLGHLIGARREAVTKTLGKMRKQGLLIKESRRLVFTNLELFKDFI